MPTEVDILIKNVIVVDSERVEGRWKPVDVAIKDGVITGVDDSLKLDSKQVIDGRGRLLIPGLIDSHTHVYQILLRGALGLRELNVHPIWLKVLIPFEAEMEKDEALVSAELACLNMVKNGVTGFLEAGGPYADLLAEVASRAGLRARVTYSTMDLGPEGYNIGPSKNRELVARWRRGRVVGWYSIRQLTLSSDSLIEETFRLAEKDGVGVHMHLSEEHSEIEHSLSRWGSRPVEYLGSRGFLSHRLVAAHCAYLTDHEVWLLARSGARVAHCPFINMAYMTFPKVPTMLREGVVVSIGSDGGSYRSIDLFSELLIAYSSHTAFYGTPYHDYSPLGLRDLIAMATVNGGRAMMEDKLGLVKTGWKADLITIRLRSPHLIPLHNPAYAVMLANGNDVLDVIVDGRVIMRDRRVLTMDEEEVIEKTESISSEVVKRVRRLLKK